MKSILILSGLFTVVNGDSCLWSIRPSPDIGTDPDTNREVDCQNLNYLGGTGLCLVNVEVDVLGRCFKDVAQICEPYLGLYGQDCFSDCSRYHSACCCEGVLTSPTETPTNKPSAKPTAIPTLKPSISIKPTGIPTKSPINPTGKPTVSKAPVTEAPTNAPTFSPTTSSPTVSAPPSLLECPWESYKGGKCIDMDVTLGSGDCKFNPGNLVPICAVSVITRCSQQYKLGWGCVKLCKDFHRECCCGMMKPTN
mmetsp:Transcript_8920/g.10329  ORF Transcript_8920/g.10329 Transcript_8920/m.10329 type:complete len:252 (+) Transcript_8920:157-912(+)